MIFINIIVDFYRKRLMKIQHTFLLLFGFIFQGISQDSNSKKADKLFSNKQYHEAAVEYQKLSESYTVLSNLADCLMYSNQLQEAIVVYSKLVATYEDSLQPQNYFNYPISIRQRIVC